MGSRLLAGVRSNAPAIRTDAVAACKLTGVAGRLEVKVNFIHTQSLAIGRTLAADRAQGNGNEVLIA